MNLNSLILNTLKPLAPTAFLNYNGTANPYITFFEFNQTGSLNADDDEQRTRHSIQVDIWSSSDYTALVKDVKESMAAIGFRRITETEFYENETDLFHKVIRFNYEN